MKLVFFRRETLTGIVCLSSCPPVISSVWNNSPPHRATNKYISRIAQRAHPDHQSFLENDTSWSSRDQRTSQTHDTWNRRGSTCHHQSNLVGMGSIVRHQHSSEGTQRRALADWSIVFVSERLYGDHCRRDQFSQYSHSFSTGSMAIGVFHRGLRGFGHSKLVHSLSGSLSAWISPDPHRDPSRKRKRKSTKFWWRDCRNIARAIQWGSLIWSRPNSADSCKYPSTSVSNITKRYAPLLILKWHPFK